MGTRLQATLHPTSSRLGPGGSNKATSGRGRRAEPCRPSAIAEALPALGSIEACRRAQAKEKEEEEAAKAAKRFSTSNCCDLLLKCCIYLLYIS